jgi:hypothetical protein
VAGGAAQTVDARCRQPCSQAETQSMDAVVQACAPGTASSAARTGLDQSASPALALIGTAILAGAMVLHLTCLTSVCLQLTDSQYCTVLTTVDNVMDYICRVLCI